jgi:16S rRNA (guanine966-N2)-methyltransferase
MSTHATDSSSAPKLRIIGGRWRSRRLKLPAGTTVRPTPNRVRETVFNWLADRLPGARCLDLFAGTGALGFEALSRGAAEAVFVESDARLVAALRHNAEELTAEARVVATTATRFLADAGLARFDLVFLDPPYSVELEPLLPPLETVLTSTALVYMERPVEQGLPELARWSWHRRARAASVCYGLARAVR